MTTKTNFENVSFEDFNLSPSLLETVKKIGFVKPMPVQAQVIPLAMQGKDVLASAQTGSGKTCAFALPIIEFLKNNPQSTALVLTPTRELAMQVNEVFESLLANEPGLYCALLVGGQSISGQVKSLKRGPRCFVGTPGRINDHIQRGSLKVNPTEVLVLDETDRMLDMGFLHQIDTIVKRMPNRKQTLMFSATFSKKIITLAQRYLNNPVRIEVDQVNAIAQGIQEELIHIEKDEKFAKLCSILKESGKFTIVFVRTKRNVETLYEKLLKQKFKVNSIHGGYRQNKRATAIENFREKKYQVIVATDIAARGLDITHIETVVNYDMPLRAEDYVHRIGRTARASATGKAISFVSTGERHLWSDIEKFLQGQEVDQSPSGQSYDKKGSSKSSAPKRSVKFSGLSKGRSKKEKTEIDNSSDIAESNILKEAASNEKFYPKPNQFERKSKSYDSSKDKAAKRREKAAAQNSGERKSYPSNHRFNKSFEGGYKKPFNSSWNKDERKPFSKDNRERKPYSPNDRFKKSSEGGYKKPFNSSWNKDGRKQFSKDPGERRTYSANDRFNKNSGSLPQDSKISGNNKNYKSSYGNETASKIYTHHNDKYFSGSKGEKRQSDYKKSGFSHGANFSKFKKNSR